MVLSGPYARPIRLILAAVCAALAVQRLVTGADVHTLILPVVGAVLCLFFALRPESGGEGKQQ